MTVNPGFGGQAYIATMEPKIAEVRAAHRGVGRLDVDSRSTAASAPTTIAGAAAAGANVLVAGSALFRDPEGLDTPWPTCGPGPKPPAAEPAAHRTRGKKVNSQDETPHGVPFLLGRGRSADLGRRNHGSWDRHPPEPEV